MTAFDGKEVIFSVFSWWFVWILAAVAGVSMVLSLIGMLFATDYFVHILLMLVGAGGVITAFIGTDIIGAGSDSALFFKAIVVMGISGMIASAVGGLTVILLKNFAEIIANTISDKPSSRPTPTVPTAPTIPTKNRYVPPVPVQSEKHLIQESFHKQTRKNRTAYIALFLAFAEEVIKFFVQDTPVLWMILTAIFLILSFVNQGVLDYRGGRDLYGTCYAEAKETAVYIFERQRISRYSSQIVFTQREIDACLQRNRISNAPNKKLDNADKTTKRLEWFLDTLFIGNPQRTGLGILLGVVLHTVYENVLPFIDLDLTLPIYFWVAFGILALYFFYYTPKKLVLGVLLGVVLHTISENVLRLLELNLTLPIYFWIAFGILALNIRNLFFAQRRIDKNLETQMRYIREAQKNGKFTKSEQRQQWRNFIALVNQKVSRNMAYNE